MNKATLQELENLHAVVAKQLTKAVTDGDMKAVAQAISFLKNNDIQVDIMESKDSQSLFSSVQDLIKESGENKRKSVEELLEEQIGS